MHNKIDYEKELNPAQLKAVQSTEGPYLVIAGAGSGKTRTLVYRVACLVERGVAPEDILLLTFTRKAAEEMLRRASCLLDERCQKVSGGTFHSFANMALRKYAKLLGLPNDFTIIDSSDAEDAINHVRSQLGFNNTEKRFPRKGAILDVISKSINKSQDIGSVLYYEYPQFAQFEDAIKKISEGYVKYKRSKSLIDYDDLLVFLRKLLKEHDETRIRLSQKYKYIMVDEYQDTNKLQAEIVYLLASTHNNIMVVGDDSQSIYSFRGANFKNIIDFPKIFEGTKIITLEENYRSTQPILNMTNEIIRFSEEKFEKTLYTKKSAGNSPVFIDAKDERAQSKYIADKITQLIDEGVEHGDISVLFRAGWHSNDLEVELARRNMPFVKYGGQRFVEAAHVKDAISYLRVVYNPLDQISWQRILLLMRGIGPKTAERIMEEITNSTKDGGPIKIKDELLKKTIDLSNLLEIINDINREKYSPGEMMGKFLKYYEDLLKLKYDDYPKRLLDLSSLEGITSRYKRLEEFLTDMALEPPEKNIIDLERKAGHKNTLTLSTIHSAKGLEWHTVFLIHVAEGHLPSYQSFESKEGIEEERRLFYVAATRAKENLFLLKPAIDCSARSRVNGSGSIFTEVSRFLNEGDILDRFVDTESVERDGFEDIEFEDVFNV